jgi:oligosaccharide repeat unit polymerase
MIAGRTRQEAGGRLEWPVALAVAVAAAVAIPFMTQPGARVYQPVPFVILLVVAAVALFREHGQHGLGLLSPLGVATLAYLIMFAVVPLADIRFDNPATYHALWWRASWIVVLGYLLIYTGYRVALAFFPPVDRNRPATWMHARATLAATVLLAIGLLSLVIQLATIGFSSYISHFAQRFTLVENGVPLLIRITLATPGFLLLAGNWVRRPTRRRGLVLMLLVLPPVLFASGFLGQRWRGLTLLVALAAIVHYGIRRIPRPLMLLLTVALAFGFVTYGSQRSTIGTNRSGPALAGANFYHHYVAKHELGQFRDFVVTLEGVPKRLSFQHGLTFLSVIPGAPFPTSSYLFSTTFFPELYAKGTGIPTPLPGELFMNFGLWGIVGGMAAFGFVLGFIESHRRRHPGSVTALLIYAYSLIPMAGVLRGSFTTFAGFFVLGLIPILVLRPFVEPVSPRSIQPSGDRTPDMAEPRSGSQG